MPMIFMYGSHLTTYRNAQSTQYKKTSKAYRKYIENIISSSSTLTQEIDYIYENGEYDKTKDIVLPYMYMPMRCSNSKCESYSMSGCHIQSTNTKKRPIVIVPLCSSCNQNLELEFKLRTGIPLMHKLLPHYQDLGKKKFKLYFLSSDPKNKPIVKDIELVSYDY